MMTKWISAPQPEKIRLKGYLQDEIIQEKDDVFSERIRQGGLTTESRNKKIPHLTEMRGTSETVDQSGTDLGISHVVKRLRNALEVKAHTA